MTGDPIPQILTILRQELHLEVGGADTDLLAGGLLDSLSFVDLLVRLEQTFAIRIDLEQIDPERFRTARAIAAYLAERSG